MTSVLIVVLNWNGIDDTEACVESLLAQSYNNYKILIVDNASSDDSSIRLQNLEAAHPEKISILWNSKNLGFAGGVNTGIKYAIEHDFGTVALLNNDAVADKNWVKNLEKHLSKDVSIVTSLLLHADGKTIDTAGDYYSTWGIGFSRNRDDKATKAPESGYVFSASGGASLYKTELFKEIGLFDEAFFAYYEDVDMGFRTQLAGHSIYYAKDAIAYHKQGATSSKIPGFTVYETFKNLPLLFWKNIPTKLLLKVGARFLVLYALIFANAVKKGSGLYALKGAIESIWYFWTDSLWKRIHIQRNRKVSAHQVWLLLYRDLPPKESGMRKFRNRFIKG